MNPENEFSRYLRIERGRQILEEKTGKAVRPYRADGYVNLLNKYGTSQDNSEAYTFEREPLVPDIQLTGMYEGNGLFSKIIDTPSEEALKHGFELGLNDPIIESFVEDALDELDWDEKAATAIKWARLYGGAIIVMLIDDGCGLEEPVNWKKIKSIDELRVYERAVVQPDYSSLYSYDNGAARGNRTSCFGKPEYYDVLSVYGSFRVHESRCLVFRNGVLPERVTNPIYQLWGIPEYVRIKKALQEAITAHQDSTKLLERSVQAIYKMKNLAQLLATDDGENQTLRRLQLIDMARGMLNSIAIDSEGEDYDFKTFQFAGVADVIDATCNMLSALTNIPQTILFGRSPAGMNATGESDFESWYNYIERIQKLMVKSNLRDLLDVVFRAGIASGEIDEEPDYRLKFNPLWSLNETEQAAVEKTKADTAMVKAQTAQVYVDMQALDPSEVRRGLAGSEDFDVEDLVAEKDDDLIGDLLGETEGNPEIEATGKNMEEEEPPGGSEQTAICSKAASSATTSIHGDDKQGRGNFGHEGRPGKVGGSSPNGGANNMIGKDINSAVELANQAGIKSKYTLVSEDEDGEEVTGTFTKYGDNAWTDGVTSLSFTDAEMARLAIDRNLHSSTLESDNVESDTEKRRTLFQEGRLGIDKYNSADKLLNDGEYSPEEVVKMADSINEYTSADYTNILAAQAGFGGLYKQSSKFMRDAKIREQAIQHAEECERFIAHADKYEGDVYRALGWDVGGPNDSGSYEKFLKQFQEGSTVQMDTMTSWTRESGYVSTIIGARTGYDEEAEFTASAVIKIKGSSQGVDISELSDIEAQGEVLFSKYTQYRVLSIRNGTGQRTDKQLEIELEEVIR